MRRRRELTKDQIERRKEKQASYERWMRDQIGAVFFKRYSYLSEDEQWSKLWSLMQEKPTFGVTTDSHKLFKYEQWLYYHVGNSFLNRYGHLSEDEQKLKLWNLVKQG